MGADESPGAQGKRSANGLRRASSFTRLQGRDPRSNDGQLAAFGLIGAAIAETRMRTAGRELLEEHRLTDPGLSIRKQLLYGLSKGYGLRVASSIAEPTDDTEPAWGDSDLILQARTTDWLISYLPGNLSHYRLVYRSRVTVIDNRSHQNIADGICDNDGATRKDITYEQLVANDAALLRAHLESAEARCLARFQSDLLALADAPAPAALATRQPNPPAEMARPAAPPGGAPLPASPRPPVAQSAVP